jgi:hypothetical protein
MRPLEAAPDVLAVEASGTRTTSVICEWISELHNYTVFKRRHHIVRSEGVALAPCGQLAELEFHHKEENWASAPIYKSTYAIRIVG